MVSLPPEDILLHVASMIYPTLIEFDPITLELSPMLVKSLPTVKTVTEGPYEGYTRFYLRIFRGSYLG